MNFTNKTIQNDEQYKEVVNKRRNKMLLIAFMGVLTLLLLWLLPSMIGFQISDFASGIYTGVGFGLISSGSIKAIQLKKIVQSSEKLKKKRIEEHDERILEISLRAYKVAGISLLVVAYFIGFIGMLFNGVFAWIMVLLVGVFLGVYTLAFVTYKNKM
ncbi:hypothetical protein ACFFIF_08800 [Vagococcus entomophilus]|uniref:Uncharacterized protein n=1 Tax=Vagococcus entomophilus TaxID=1160095 RepID=A0A430AH12_9ENTE|nr:hypothetical protein [Vagococcus entomophilus]RSU07144.1 hypothetical protein CBF30_07775 [Vagococcus entomophilus]